VLIESLEFAEAYVDAIITRGGHDRRACHCESCKWLRRIRRLSRKIGCVNDPELVNKSPHGCGRS
jgi:hypothetical protein